MVATALIGQCFSTVWKKVAILNNLLDEADSRELGAAVARTATLSDESPGTIDCNNGEDCAENLTGYYYSSLLPSSLNAC